MFVGAMQRGTSAVPTGGGLFLPPQIVQSHLLQTECTPAARWRGSLGTCGPRVSHLCKQLLNADASKIWRVVLCDKIIGGHRLFAKLSDESGTLVLDVT